MPANTANAIPSPSGDDMLDAIFRTVARPVAPAGDDCERERETRLKHINCAFHVLSGRYSSRAVGALFEVSHTAVLLWTEQALTYDDPEAEGLRKVFGRTRPRAG